MFAGEVGGSNPLAPILFNNSDSWQGQNAKGYTEGTRFTFGLCTETKVVHRVV